MPFQMRSEKPRSIQRPRGVTDLAAKGTPAARPTCSYERPTVASQLRVLSPYTHRRMCQLSEEARQRLSHLQLGPFRFKKESEHQAPFVVGASGHFTWIVLFQVWFLEHLQSWLAHRFLVYLLAVICLFFLSKLYLFIDCLHNSSLTCYYVYVLVSMSVTCSVMPLAVSLHTYAAVLVGIMSGPQILKWMYGFGGDVSTAFFGM